MAEQVIVEFSQAVQSLNALQAAAYRLLDVANCQIMGGNGRIMCHLTPKEGCDLGGEALRSRFVDLVTDENVREGLATRVAPVRNLILSLAFGALAAEGKVAAE